ncbi:hypothetical protein QFC21_000925 [Naganishia friedmannii]|uniref:Uncharacterized protein n=1 Tax=Naganishia friedmannii TaxID=89922 RepID=A0ACC2W8P3_9TREE|nr:hypothetical protein QFC21_000925 [Naganishia friedmannii]
MYPSSNIQQEYNSQQETSVQQDPHALPTSSIVAPYTTYQGNTPYQSYYQQPVSSYLAYRSLDALAERETTTRAQNKEIKRQKLDIEMKQQGYHPERGVGNTFYLSIRSGIPEEIDRALPVILEYSRRDGITSDFSVYPGSIEALLGLVDEWVEDWEDYMQRASAGLEGEWLQSQEEADHARWALGALLAIRNGCIAHEKVRLLLIGVRGKYSQEDLANLRNTRGINGSNATLPYLPPRILILIGKILQNQSVLDLALRMPEMSIYLLDILILILPYLIHTLRLSSSKPSTSGSSSAANSKAATPAVNETPEEEDVGDVTLRQTGNLLKTVLAEWIPASFTKASDLAVLLASIQLFTMVPSDILPVDSIIDRLATFLVLTPSQREQTPWPKELFLQSLGLLYHITAAPSQAAEILRRRDLDGQLRILIGLTQWGTKAVWKQMRVVGAIGRVQEISPIDGVGTMTNVKGLDKGGKWLPPVLLDDDGGELTGEEVGLGPLIVLDPLVRRKIRSLREPDRALAWMKECLVFQPESYMTQVTFWTAYQNFVAPDPTEPPIAPPTSAAEVIKAATSAYSGASAMVMREDRDGRPLRQPKFVINGLRFKRSLGVYFLTSTECRLSWLTQKIVYILIGRRKNYMCKWQGCAEKIGPLSNAELLAHVKTCHLADLENPNGGFIKCRWAHCLSNNATQTHMLTHLPLPIDPTKEPEPLKIIVHPDTAMSSVTSSYPQFRPIPPLTYIGSIPPAGAKQAISSSDLMYPLAYLGLEFPLDRTGQPMQEGYYACMILKNMARALRNDIERAEDSGLLDSEEYSVHDGNDISASGRATSSRNRKKRKLDRLGAFGLPAPPGILDGSYIDPTLTGVNGHSGDNKTAAEDRTVPREAAVLPLKTEERVRARLAFRSAVEEPVLSMLEQGGGEIPKRLIECLGF